MARLKVVEPEPTLSVAELRKWIESGEARSVLDVLVTPLLASCLLEYNSASVTNRPLSKRGIEASAEALKKGQWENTGSPIVISAERILNDGQHRLEAVVQTGIPAIMDLRFGVARHAFAVTDAGRKRTGGDVLGIMGFAAPTMVASVARMTMAYMYGLPQGLNYRWGNGDVARAVEQWPDMPQGVRPALNLPKMLRVSAMGTLAFFASRTANEHVVHDFFRVLRTGAGDADNPPHVLRDTILLRGPHYTGYDRARSLAIGIIAWNAFRKSQRLNKLDWQIKSKFPTVDGLKL